LSATAVYTVKCRHDHRFTTKARPGGTTHCPQCRREGNRVAVRVPIGAGRQARTAAPAELGEGAETARLAAAWAAEAPAVAEWRAMPMRPAEGTQCAKCGGPMAWHSAHTILVCLACPIKTVSPGAIARARAHAAAEDRRQARGAATVADIDPGAEGRARAARIETTRKREILRYYTEQMIAVCDPAIFRRAQFATLALGMRGKLRGYLAELGAADDAALEQIDAELAAIEDGGDYRRLAAAAAVVGEARELADGDEDYDEDYDEDEGQGDEGALYRRPAPSVVPGYVAPDPGWRRDPGAVAYYDGLARRTSELAAPRRRAIARPPTAPGAAATGIVGALIKMRRGRKAEQARNGRCGFCARGAVRIYGISLDYLGGAINTGYPNVRACARHYAAADSWIEARRGGLPAYHWELARTV
jgi:hypothetical protein